MASTPDDPKTERSIVLIDALGPSVQLHRAFTFLEAFFNGQG
jgi:hypothetical protein